MDRGWKGKVAVTLLLLQPASAAVLRTKVRGPSPRPQRESKLNLLLFGTPKVKEDFLLILHSSSETRLQLLIRLYLQFKKNRRKLLSQPKNFFGFFHKMLRNLKAIPILRKGNTIPSQSKPYPHSQECGPTLWSQYKLNNISLHLRK